MTPQEFAAWWPAPDTEEEIAAADAREIAQRCEGCGAASIATCSCDYHLEDEDGTEGARRNRG
jgi:hypothetical protein